MIEEFFLKETIEKAGWGVSFLLFVLIMLYRNYNKAITRGDKINEKRISEYKEQNNQLRNEISTISNYSIKETKENQKILKEILKKIKKNDINKKDE